MDSQNDQRILELRDREGNKGKHLFVSDDVLWQLENETDEVAYDHLKPVNLQRICDAVNAWCNLYRKNWRVYPDFKNTRLKKYQIPEK